MCPHLDLEAPCGGGTLGGLGLICSCKPVCLRVGSPSSAFLATEQKTMLASEEALPMTVWVGCRATMQARSAFGVPR